MATHFSQAGGPALLLPRQLPTELAGVHRCRTFNTTLNGHPQKRWSLENHFQPGTRIKLPLSPPNPQVHTRFVEVDLSAYSVRQEKAPSEAATTKFCRNPLVNSFTASNRCASLPNHHPGRPSAKPEQTNQTTCKLTPAIQKGNKTTNS